MNKTQITYIYICIHNINKLKYELFIYISFDDISHNKPFTIEQIKLSNK